MNIGQQGSINTLSKVCFQQLSDTLQASIICVSSSLHCFEALTHINKHLHRHFAASNPSQPVVKGVSQRPLGESPSTHIVSPIHTPSPQGCQCPLLPRGRPFSPGEEPMQGRGGAGRQHNGHSLSRASASQQWGFYPLCVLLLVLL